MLVNVFNDLSSILLSEFIAHTYHFFFQMFELTGRRVIITGAAQGFGKEFARRLLQENCHVCISDVDVTTGTKTKATFQKEFGLEENELCFVKCDVSIINVLKVSNELFSK